MNRTLINKCFTSLLPPRLQVTCQLEYSQWPAYNTQISTLKYGWLFPSKHVDCSDLCALFIASDKTLTVVSVSVCVARHADRCSCCAARTPPPVFASHAGSI